MPPLGAERFITPTELTEEQKALAERLRTTKAATYNRMATILPKKGGAFSSSTQLDSAKAVYQVKGQSEDVLTRAWLQRRRGPDGGEISLYTDKVAVSGGQTTVLKGSEFMHLALGAGGITYTDEYLGLTTEQELELWDGVADTLNLIEEAAFKAEVGKQTS